MKKAILLLAVCIATLSAMAQNKAEILVNYDYTHPSTQDKPLTAKMSLLASATEAKYFNEMSQWVDSMMSTPEGEAKYNEIFEKACMTMSPEGYPCFDMTKGPVKSISTYVFTNLIDEKITYYEQYGEDPGTYTENTSEMEWTMIDDSTATVLGYECLLAETDYHGRHWRAWFAPELPMPFGPWKLHGLPGIILKAEANGRFSFTATNVGHTNSTIQPMYSQQDYAKMDRKKALANAEYFENNIESIKNAQGIRMTISTTDENGNEIETPKFDGLKHSLEPDYKMK